MIGCALACFTSKGWRIPSRNVGAVGAALLGTFLLLSLALRANSSLEIAVGLIPVQLVCAALIACVVSSDENAPFRRLLELRGLMTLGVVSYGVYLWHKSLLLILRGRLQKAGHAREAVVVLAATALCTTISWIFVERRFLRMK